MIGVLQAFIAFGMGVAFGVLFAWRVPVARPPAERRREIGQ